MILTDRDIQEACEKQEILIDPFESNQVQGATYDLRVGKQGATTSSKKIVNIEEDGYLLLKPGDFAIVVVLEKLRLSPQYVVRFGLRSKYARIGLIATTGPQIDPGYDGRLILGLTNLTPKSVSLPYKDDLVSVEIHKLEKPSTKPYSGPYQKKYELGPEDIESIVEAEAMTLSEVLTTLTSLSKNVGALTSDVRMMKWIIPIIVGLGITVIGIIVSCK
ncbi:dCTP deaminase [bacterium]|nr:dCTP deaminase [bacterium]